MAEAKVITLGEINLVAFLKLKNIPVRTTVQNGRVSWEIDATDEVYELLREFNGNASVSVVDFITVLKGLRGEMLNLRGLRS